MPAMTSHRRHEHNDVRLDRLQLVSIVLPLAYIVGLVTAVASFGLPLLAAAAITAAISLPVVALFALLVFRSIISMRDELMQRERKFRGLLESAPDAIVIVDTRGTIMIVNEQTEAMFGYAQDELIGAAVETLLPETRRAGHARHRDGYIAHPGTRPMGAGLDLVARRADGSEFPAEISLSPIETEDGMLVTSTIRDITERRRFEAERNALLAEAEAEHQRQRIGMDLHDGVMQSIYAVGLKLENAAADVREDPDAVHARIDGAIEALDDVMRDIRSYIMDLRPTKFTGDLRESLANLVRDFQVNSLVDATVALADSGTISEGQASMLFHIAQEALTNARKHARATSLWLSLGTAPDGGARLEIRDNGAGFDTAASVGEEHHGLRNMASRARAAGGTLSVISAPGGGTSVTVDIPPAELPGQE